MSNLGFQTVYGILNKRSDVVCERFFLPDLEEEHLLKKYQAPLLSAESQRPMKDFDLVLFSVSFESDYLNVLKILSMAGIPFWAEERKNDYSLPFIGAGGIATWLNPEPLDLFMDFFLIGEGEGFLDEFISNFLRYEAERRHRLFLIARDTPGVYVPWAYQPLYASEGTLREMKPSKELPYPIIKRRVKKEEIRACSQIVTSQTEFSNMFLIEIERGCPRGCRFCGAGYVYRPPRMRPLDSILKDIKEGIKLSDKIGLIGAAVNDYPYLKEILEFILIQNAHFSVSSLRADALSLELLEIFKRNGHKTITIAPEAGSQRLRNVINKGLSEDQILKAASLVSECGFKTLKLYFIIGLPTENQKDIEAIFGLVKKIKKDMLNRHQGRFCPQIYLSVASFVPKPFTPFQWHPMEEISALKKKGKWLKTVFKRERGVSLSFDLPKWAYVQALLARGDRRVGEILYLAFKMGWEQALKKSVINPDFFVLRPRDANEFFPWEVISHGLNREFLYQEYQKALSAKPGSICPMKECNLCGVCRGL